MADMSEKKVYGTLGKLGVAMPAGGYIAVTDFHRWLCPDIAISDYPVPLGAASPAGLQAFAGLSQTLPRIAFHLMQQQNLAHSAGGHLGAHQSCGQNLRVVYHKQISRLQKIRQIVKDMVLNLAAFTPKAQKASTVARVSRLLCNQFFWQVIPKILFQHMKSFPFPAPLILTVGNRIL